MHLRLLSHCGETEIFWVRIQRLVQDKPVRFFCHAKLKKKVKVDYNNRVVQSLGLNCDTQHVRSKQMNYKIDKIVVSLLWGQFSLYLWTTTTGALYNLFQPIHLLCLLKNCFSLIDFQKERLDTYSPRWTQNDQTKRAVCVAYDRSVKYSENSCSNEFISITILIFAECWLYLIWNCNRHEKLSRIFATIDYDIFKWNAQYRLTVCLLRSFSLSAIFWRAWTQPS